MIKRSLTLSVALAVLVLTGCDKDEKKDASQVIAKVGDAEVTVHQLNHALSRLQGIKPEQAELARQEIAMARAKGLHPQADCAAEAQALVPELCATRDQLINLLHQLVAAVVLAQDD